MSLKPLLIMFIIFFVFQLNVTPLQILDGFKFD